MKEVESHCLLHFSLELGCLRSVVPEVLFWGNAEVQHIHHLRRNLSGASPSGGKGTQARLKLHCCQGIMYSIFQQWDVLISLLIKYIYRGKSFGCL